MPFWDEKCVHAFRAFTAVPKRAIQYGKFTKNRGRYYFNYTKKKNKRSERKLNIMNLAFAGFATVIFFHFTGGPQSIPR